MFKGCYGLDETSFGDNGVRTIQKYAAADNTPKAWVEILVLPGRILTISKGITDLDGAPLLNALSYTGTIGGHSIRGSLSSRCPWRFNVDTAMFTVTSVGKDAASLDLDRDAKVYFDTVSDEVVILHHGIEMTHTVAFKLIIYDTGEMVQ